MRSGESEMKNLYLFLSCAPLCDVTQPKLNCFNPKTSKYPWGFIWVLVGCG